MTRIPIPKPSYLDEMESLGFIHGARRWRSPCGRRLYTWDEFHGEIEVFTKRGKHLGVIDAVTGENIKDAVKGRTIDV
jgi:hypothetical protein